MGEYSKVKIKKLQHPIYLVFAIMSALICRFNRLRENYSLLKFQYESEQKRAEDVKELYLQIRSMRHDMKNHLSTVNILASQDKCSEIFDYTSDLINDNSYISKTFIFTGNDLLDAVVNMKFSIAENLGIYIFRVIFKLNHPIA